MDTNSPGFAAQYLVLQMPNDSKFEKLYCSLNKCQMYLNKAVQNSERVQFDLDKKKTYSKVFIFETLFSPSSVFSANKAPSGHVQIAIQ